MSKLIHEVAGVIYNNQRKILIAKRPQDKHQGGLWEFPGGKLEPDETVEAALKRELSEELGIIVQDYEKLLDVRHDYQDKSVFLDIWRVNAFTGEAEGRENQEVRWIALNEIGSFQFPAANHAIIEYLVAE